MKLSARGATFIKLREACLLTPMWDAIGKVWNIGYGHVLKPGEPRLPITQEEADALFDIDILYREDSVNDLVLVSLTQNQFDALVSFVYNLGHGNFSKSTLLKRVNASLHDAAAVQFLQWNMAKGKKIRGLCNRRYDEVMVYSYADYSWV